MKPAFFASFRIGAASIDSITDEYLQWALGRGRFSGYRNARLQAGIPSSLTMEMMRSSGDYVGQNDCLVAVRRADDFALLRLVQRDGDDGSIFWHNIIRLTRSSEGVEIEHAIMRSAPRGMMLAPKASSPSVVQKIIAAYSSGGVEPRDLYNARIVCSDGQETEAFVEHVLLDSSREVPVLVVTSFARTDHPVVDTTVLAKQLRGMATIVELRTRECPEALTSSLLHEGFDRQFSCFDGGVRLYAPRPSKRDALPRHTLWIRTWLLDLSDDPRKRTEILAGLVAGRVADARMPRDLVSCVQDYDRHERRRRAEIVLATPPPHPAASTDLIISQSNAQLAALETELRGANELIELYDSTNRDMAAQIEEATKRIAELEYEAQQERLKAEALEQQLDAKQQRDIEGLSSEVRADIAASLRDEASPESALRLISLTWPNRVVVLESAVRSAKKSESFKFSGDALDLLTRLVTDYFEAIQAGGDTAARKVFGASEYAAKESERVMANKAAVKRRTFNYKGQQVEMFAHLKIGTKDSVAETLRIHFHWDADDTKIVIGYCGPHLDFN